MTLMSSRGFYSLFNQYVLRLMCFNVYKHGLMPYNDVI